jgi:hypothetical protein
MILNTHTPEIERSSSFDETLFSIGDTGLILDILRNKMYSNPIQSICREISCNARDAHREVKTPDLPIQITIPNTLEPNYRIKDWGPGLSPDRIEEIYTRYGVSTKRNDNSQTGGFGIGSKVGWSYSTDFSVETIYNGTKYNYHCYIDESNIGKIALFSSEETSDPNGTEIIIPVKGSDFKAFKEGTEFVTRHWEVKPIIKGDTINFHQPVFEHSGQGWSVDVSSPRDYDSQSSEIKLIIDSIEYPVDVQQLKQYGSTQILNALRGSIYLYFGVGELSLSANREAVHLDKETITKIGEKLETVIKDFKAVVQNKIDACNSLWDANIYYQHTLYDTFTDLAFLGKGIKWRGTLVSDRSLPLSSVASISRFYRVYRRSSKTNQITKATNTYLYFEENSKLILNDIGVEPAYLINNHVKSLFANDTSLQSVQIITLQNGITWEMLNTQHNIDKMEPLKLSDVVAAANVKITSKMPSASKVRLLIFKCSNTGSFGQVAYKTMKADTNKKIICALTKTGYANAERQVILKNGKWISSETFVSLLESKNVSIYGVDERIPQEQIDEHFADFTSIETFIDNKLLKSKEIDYVELKYAVQKINRYDDYSSLIRHCKDKIKSNTSLALKMLSLQDHYLSLMDKKDKLLTSYELIREEISEKEIQKWITDNPEKDFDTVLTKTKKQYPLLNHISFYYDERLAEPLIHYINLMDKENRV